MNCPRCQKPMRNLGNVTGIILTSNPPQHDETHVCHGCHVKVVERVVEPYRHSGLSYEDRRALDAYTPLPAPQETEP